MPKPRYHPSDVEVLFRRGNWQNWDDAIQWLEENGEADEDVGSSEARAMREDLLRLRDAGFRFTHKPDEVYRMAHEHRHHEKQPGRR